MNWKNILALLGLGALVVFIVSRMKSSSSNIIPEDSPRAKALEAEGKQIAKNLGGYEDIASGFSPPQTAVLLALGNRETDPTVNWQYSPSLGYFKTKEMPESEGGGYQIVNE